MGWDILSGLGEWSNTGSGQNAEIEGLNRKAQVTAYFLKGVSAVKKLGATDLKHDMIFLSPSTGASIKSCFVCWFLKMCSICKNKNQKNPTTNPAIISL